MAVKNYGIRDQWTNLDKLNNVDIKSVDGVIESVKINGEEAGGGGGSSDFSTAEVTIQITTGNPDVYITIPTIVTSPMDMILNQQYNAMNSSAAQILTLPLYKGALAISGQSAGEISVNVSGSVEKVGTLDFIITGDCAITIS